MRRFTWLDKEFVLSEEQYEKLLSRFDPDAQAQLETYPHEICFLKVERECMCPLDRFGVMACDRCTFGQFGINGCMRITTGLSRNHVILYSLNNIKWRTDSDIKAREDIRLIREALLSLEKIDQ